MRSLAGLVLVAVVGCESPHRSTPDAAPIDAAFDGTVACRRIEGAVPDHAQLVSAADVLIPFTTTGTTPAGSLDDIRYLGVNFYGGDCPTEYALVLFRPNESSGENEAAVLVTIRYPFTELSSGTVAGTAWLDSDYCTLTDQVRFEVEHIDPPGAANPLRIAGRVKLDDGAWHLDFAVDATTAESVCI